MPNLGDRATCAACQQPIEWRGENWAHLGEHQPRHIAEPVESPDPPSMRPGPELNERVAFGSCRVGDRAPIQHRHSPSNGAC